MKTRNSSKLSVLAFHAGFSYFSQRQPIFLFIPIFNYNYNIFEAQQYDYDSNKEPYFQESDTWFDLKGKILAQVKFISNLVILAIIQIASERCSIASQIYRAQTCFDDAWLQYLSLSV